MGMLSWATMPIRDIHGVAAWMLSEMLSELPEFVRPATGWWDWVRD